ncbi:proline-rich protein 5 isoform X2 [Trachypithecus francoisi]|nr:proline-rich protein 5 isoform X2 [Trachypithecus francoisi]XP_033089530.1 proline-rich protein 5 isoform X2 [Trachypithecus francoisi]XP_033089531.1 proline-rich protein 5 isoform X2 [Trachypithecus francoisi]
MSSPSLSDLGKREPAAAADERGTQQRRACANATWNSIHNGVIAVFQRKGLPDQELFSLNEGVRQLLKTELGSFFTEYLQNQLLTKGMVILRDKIRFYEGQKLLDSLAETWDFFFSDVLPMLQAIFYPVQGKEPSVRQLALLHFRNAITLSVKLEDALARAHARVPPAIVQMLLVLQGVHESRGVTEDYLRLETLVQKVVSPYLGTYGLHSSEGSFTHSCILGSPHPQDGIPALTLHGGPVPICPHRSPTTWPHGSPVWTSCRPLLHPLGHQLQSGGGCTCLGKCRRPAEKRLLRRSRSGDVLAKNPVVRSKSYNTPLLNPVQEHEAEGAAAGGPSIRRHSVSEMTSCPEPQGFSDPPGQGSAGAFRSSPAPHSGPCPSRLYPTTQPPEQGLDPTRSSLPCASPENLVDQILESVDSDSEGIFIDFGRGQGRGSGMSNLEGSGGRQSVV